MPNYEAQQLHAAIDAHIAHRRGMLPKTVIFSPDDAATMLDAREFYYADLEFSRFIPVDNHTHVAAALGKEDPNPIPGYSEVAPMWQIRRELAKRGERVRVMVPSANT